MSCKYDFKSDLKTAILDEAFHLGIKISSSKSLYDILIDYLTIYHKLIPSKPRDVFVCPQLKADLSTHPKAKEIRTIIEIAKRGGNLNPFQSKRLLQTNFHDHMITEWNIYHYHLSLEQVKKTKFVKQVNSLLFAYIDNNSIAFLGVETHKDGIFGDTKWWTLLHDNFPQLIEKYKNDARDVYPPLSASDRQQLWDKGYTTFMVKVKDCVYYSPNIGRTTSGHNMVVIRQAMSILDWIDSISEQLDKYYDAVCNALKVESAVAQYKVIIYGEDLILAEMSSLQQVLKFNEVFDLSKLR